MRRLSIMAHASTALLAMCLILSLIPGSVVRGEGDGRIVSVGGDWAVDLNGDGINDALAVNVTIGMNEGGEVGIYGTISNSGGITSQYKGNFSPGTHSVSLYFSGEEIYNKNLEGSFVVVVYLVKDGSLLDSAKYTTAQYSSEDFNPYGNANAKVESVKVYMEKGSVVIQGEKMTVQVFTSEPTVRYYYTGESNLMLEVTYVEAVVYGDANGNGRWDEGEEMERFDFSSMQWSLSLDLVEGYDRFDFSISGSTGANVSALQGMGLEVSFHYSSAARSMDHWGRQKFDVDLHVSNIKVNDYRVALIQTVEALKGRGNFMPLEHTGNEWDLVFADSGRDVGSYSLLDHAEFYMDGGHDIKGKGVNVSAYTLEVSDRVVKLVCDYGVSDGEGWIHHDPTLGLNLDYLAPVSGAVVEIIKHSPELLAASAFVTTFVVALNIRNYRKKRQLS